MALRAPRLMSSLPNKAVFCISAEFCTDPVPMQTDEGEILEEGSPKVSEGLFLIAASSWQNCEVYTLISCQEKQMEHEDFVMEGHGKTPPPGEENKQSTLKLH
nr:uncharacterized protein LOC112984129 [Dromaius novaehollandiae]